jgi:hypothetical protein
MGSSAQKTLSVCRDEKSMLWVGERLRDEEHIARRSAEPKTAKLAETILPPLLLYYAQTGQELVEVS